MAIVTLDLDHNGEGNTMIASRGVYQVAAECGSWGRVEDVIPGRIEIPPDLTRLSVVFQR